MNDPDDRADEVNGRANDLTQWILVALATLAASGAVLRVCWPSDMPLFARLDEKTLLYLAVAGGLLMLRQVKSLTFGSYKLEMLEKIRERQARQEDELDNIAMVMPLLFPATERQHLLNLADGKTEAYRGNPALKTELRRLASIGLIRRHADRRLHAAGAEKDFNLAEYVELTDLGRRWVKKMRQIEDAEIAD
jgi:hypothetical protein